MNTAFEKIRRYTCYMKTDLGRVKSKKCDVINNDISSHLCEAYAFMATPYLLDDIIGQDPNLWMYKTLVQLFHECFIEYAARFYVCAGFDTPLLDEVERFLDEQDERINKAIKVKTERAETLNGINKLFSNDFDF